MLLQTNLLIKHSITCTFFCSLECVLLFQPKTNNWGQSIDISSTLCVQIKKEACAAFLFIKKNFSCNFTRLLVCFNFSENWQFPRNRQLKRNLAKKKPWTTMHFEGPNLSTNFFLFPALLRSLITPTNKQGSSYVLLFGTSVFFIKQNVPTLNLWWKNNLHTRQSHFSIFLPFTKQKCMCL